MDDPRDVDARDPRLGELRDIVAELERGGSLLDLAARLDALTAGAAAGEAEVLVAALREDVGRRRPVRASAGRAVPRAPATCSTACPRATRRSRSAGRALQVDVLAAALAAELERLGGSPSRGRWAAARPLVTRLVDGLQGLELRVRREREAWLPALERRGAGDAARLVRDRQDDVLERLRLMRLALARRRRRLGAGARPRAAAAACASSRCARSRCWCRSPQRVLTPREWAEVRRQEDGVGWSLIPAPPSWPKA